MTGNNKMTDSPSFPNSSIGNPFDGKKGWCDRGWWWENSINFITNSRTIEVANNGGLAWYLKRCLMVF